LNKTDVTRATVESHQTMINVKLKYKNRQRQAKGNISQKGLQKNNSKWH